MNATYIPYRGAQAGAGTGFQSALATQTTAAPGSVNSNGLSISSIVAAVTGGIATALASNPIAAVGSSISGVLTDAQGVIQGAN